MEIKIHPLSRLFFGIILLVFAFPLFAEDSFPQKIEWKSNANALEYKVELQNLSTGKTQSITTEKTSTELSLLPARYRYRVHAYDFLGKEASVSSWTNFEVFKASKPKINKIERKLQVPKDGGPIGISVDIADVNKNSKFELVNESLNGIISASDKMNMGQSSSETDSISHLDFKNVPPGNWRLRVTNPSGLSSVSDIIVVDGEKMFTDVEVALIRDEAVNEAVKETEEKLRKEMNEKLSSEIEKAIAEHDLKKERAEADRIEAEKRAEEERLEAEKRAEEERLEAERKAEEEARLAEIARIEEEKRAKEEAKRAKEEEKLRRKLERKKLGYQWKDFIIEGGAGVTNRLYDDSFKEAYDEPLATALNIRAMYLPKKTSSAKFGMEVCYFGQKFTHETNFLNAELISNVFDAKIVWQQNLMPAIYLQLKGGAGINMLKKSISYSSSYTARTASEDTTYFYPLVAGNLSIFCNPLKFLVFEAGADFSHVFGGSFTFGMLTPYACAGIRF